MLVGHPMIIGNAIIVEGGPFGGTLVPIDDLPDIWMKDSSTYGYVYTWETNSGRPISLEYDDDLKDLQSGSNSAWLE